MNQLILPRIRQQLLSRPELFLRLEAGLAGRLITICAPAGFGKTTLVAHWIEQHFPPTHAVTWHTLDTFEDEPYRFFTRLGRVLAPDDLEIHHLRDVWEVLLNAFADLPQPLLIVLDDYHVMEHPQIHEGMNLLLAHLPPHICFLITSRGEVPLQLGRLRANGELLEFGADDLRFSDHEQTLFFQDILATPLPPKALLDTTEGWVASLQLLALAQQKQVPLPQNYVFAYLSEEILSRQSPEVQTFLYQTSILKRFNLALAQALTGYEDCSAILEKILHEQLFISEIEAGWYRYHALFQEFLQTQLANPATLYGTAAHWCWQAGLMPEAFDYAQHIPDPDLMTQIILAEGRKMLQLGQAPQLLKWIEALPNPPLAVELLRAWALEHGYRLAELPPLLDRLEMEASYRGEVEAIRARLHLLDDQMDAVIEHAERALALLPADATAIRGDVLLALGLAHNINGNLTQADQLFMEALRLSQEAGNVRIILRSVRHMARIRRSRGQYRATERLCEEILAQIEAGNIPSTPSVASVYLSLTPIYYQRNQVDAAEALIDKAIHLSETGHENKLLIMSLLVKVDILCYRHDWQNARRLLDKAERLSLGSEFYTYRIVIHLKMGDLARASQILSEKGITLTTPIEGIPNTNLTTLCHVLLMNNETEKAYTLAQRLFDHVQPLGLVLWEVELRQLLAIAVYRQGQTELAFAHLTAAVTRLESEGIVRLLADNAPILWDVWQAFMAHTLTLSPAARPPISQDFLQTLHATIAQSYQRDTSITPANEALNAREVEILMLVAQGLGNREVGERLSLSDETVKWYLKQIYRKLDAHNRTEAVTRARQHGIVP